MSDVSLRWFAKRSLDFDSRVEFRLAFEPLPEDECVLTLEVDWEGSVRLTSSGFGLLAGLAEFARGLRDVLSQQARCATWACYEDSWSLSLERIECRLVCTVHCAFGDGVEGAVGRAELSRLEIDPEDASRLAAWLNDRVREQTS